MAWFGDEMLILLPQYPEKFGDGAYGAVFALPKSQILGYLEGETQTPIQPVEIPFDDAGFSTSIPGYEGFESIAISGNSVYLTIESSPGEMVGYLVSGQISPGLESIRLASNRQTAIPPQASLKNYSDEALLAFGDRLVSIFELNGAALNPDPVAHLFDLSMQLQDTLAFPAIEYRITDATPPDEFGRFWAINYFFPGDADLKPTSDPIQEMYGEGFTHTRSDAVERLIELQFSETGIVLSDSAPIQLELLSGDQARNWEAIGWLDGLGFLLASDRYPDTILGFVQYP